MQQKRQGIDYSKLEGWRNVTKNELLQDDEDAVSDITTRNCFAGT